MLRRRPGDLAGRGGRVMWRRRRSSGRRRSRSLSRARARPKARARAAEPTELGSAAWQALLGKK